MMDYLDKLDIIQKLRDDFEEINKTCHAFGYSVNEQIYSLNLLTHVTELNGLENSNYHTTLIIGDDKDEKIHTLIALISALDQSGLLQLTNQIIKDYEEQKKSDI